jgi:hypothetical protein
VLSPLRANAPLENVVEIKGLVGAVKATDPKVHNGWPKEITPVRRPGHLQRQRFEVGLAKLPRLTRSGRESAHSPILGRGATTYQSLD